MTREEQIASLRQRLDDVDAKIAGLQARRSVATEASECVLLDAQIASSQETRQALETMLNNVEASPLVFTAGSAPAPVASPQPSLSARKKG